MISFNKQVFKGQVVSIRKRIIDLSKEKAGKQVGQSVVESLLQLKEGIEQYIKKITNDVQKLKNNQNNVQILQISQLGKYQNQKSILYLWQVINFIIINTEALKGQVLSIISNLLNASIKHSYCFSPNTNKNGLISIHNFIANAIKTEQIIKTCEQDIFQWFQQILTYHFLKQQTSNKHISSFFKQEKVEQNFIDETEWIAYIFKQLFSNKFYQSNQNSFIQQFEAKSKNQMIGYYTLHMIGNFFQDIIDKRVTTQLVQGYQCKISDIKQMYCSKDKILVSFKITKYDLKWICKSLNKNIKEYNEVVRDYLKSQINKEDLLVKEILQKWKRLADMIQQNIHILNCLLFIGGYNSKLQDQIIQGVLQTDKQLLNYLEISYLLYRNIEATKYKTKVSLVVEMQKEAKLKLLKIASIEYGNIDQIDMKALNLDKILAKGQLVSLLRLMANLVHINKRAQKPFEQQVKYLHMILSLTHDSISQATMKEWAIMFIKNVSQWSEKLRQQISSIKIEMKVQ